MNFVKFKFLTFKFLYVCVLQMLEAKLSFGQIVAGSEVRETAVGYMKVCIFVCPAGVMRISRFVTQTACRVG